MFTLYPGPGSTLASSGDPCRDLRYFSSEVSLRARERKADIESQGITPLHRVVFGQLAVFQGSSGLRSSAHAGSAMMVLASASITRAPATVPATAPAAPLPLPMRSAVAFLPGKDPEQAALTSTSSPVAPPAGGSPLSPAAPDDRTLAGDCGAPARTDAGFTLSETDWEHGAATKARTLGVRRSDFGRCPG
jgi:hypothetical protein